MPVSYICVYIYVHIYIYIIFTQWSRVQRAWSRGPDESWWHAWWARNDEGIRSTWTWEGTSEGWSHEWICPHEVKYICQSVFPFFIDSLKNLNYH